MPPRRGGVNHPGHRVSPGARLPADHDDRLDLRDLVEDLLDRADPRSREKRAVVLEEWIGNLRRQFAHTRCPPVAAAAPGGLEDLVRQGWPDSGTKERHRPHPRGRTTRLRVRYGRKPNNHNHSRHYGVALVNESQMRTLKSHFTRTRASLSTRQVLSQPRG